MYYFFVLDMKYQPFGSHAIEIKMRSLMFKSPPSTAKYDTTSLNEIEMTSTAMPRPKKIFLLNTSLKPYLLVSATSSGILKAKQKLRRTFDSDKLGGIDFTKISKLTMCSA